MWNRRTRPIDTFCLWENKDDQLDGHIRYPMKALGSRAGVEDYL